MIAILMMSTKFATAGFLEIKAFRSKGCDVIVSIKEVIYKI